MECLLKQSERKLSDLQTQITKLNEILVKRDETIKEYEDKVRELAFQNAELLEIIENKDNEIIQNEVSLVFRITAFIIDLCENNMKKIVYLFCYGFIYVIKLL